MINSEELIGTTKYLTLYVGCRINQCRYNRVRLCVCVCVCVYVCVCVKIVRNRN